MDRRSELLVAEKQTFTVDMTQKLAASSDNRTAITETAFMNQSYHTDGPLHSKFKVHLRHHVVQKLHVDCALASDLDFSSNSNGWSDSLR